MIWLVCASLTAATLCALLIPLWSAERRAAIGIAVTVAAGSGLLYGAMGSPGLPDAPYAARWRQPDFASATGDDAFARGDMTEAVAAYRHAIDLGLRDGALYARLGEANVVLANGTVTPEAARNFAEALSRNPREPRARFFGGLALAQHGRLAQALAIWRDLKRDSKPGAPWMARLDRRIKEAETALRTEKN